LVAAKHHGVEAEVCASCDGVWLTQKELDDLENEVYDLGKKGSLVFNAEASTRLCPQCAGVMQRFEYRDYDLQLEYCAAGHGFWLDKGEDKRVIALMKQEERGLERKFRAEDAWSAHLKHWRSANFFDKLRGLFG
jgi:Zn-finger nucleic acid-binding protein